MMLRPSAAGPACTTDNHEPANTSDCCRECGAPLAADEIAMTKKLINRGTSNYLCYPCLACFFGCDVALLQRKAEQFRAQGCALFSPVHNTD